MSQNSLLEPEQVAVLEACIEAYRRTPRQERQPFIYVAQPNGDYYIHHPGLPRRMLQIYYGDLESLEREDLVVVDRRRSDVVKFSLTPDAFAFYARLREQTSEPVEHVTDEIRRYLDGDEFRSRYPAAHAKWCEAEGLLWQDDSELRFTTIGHLCREAIQEFATGLIEKHRPDATPTDKSRDVARVRSVLEQRKARLSASVAPFLDALLVYWGTVSDLVQRQEHGGQREREPLVWEDGRRVVFQTAIVMYEIDRALQ